MKFMLHPNPVVPASPAERERLRPIAHRTDKIQQMLREMVELTQMAEELVPKPFQKPHPPLFQALTTTEETIRWAAREAVSRSTKSSASSNCLAPR